MLILPDQRDQAPTNPELILAFVRDNIPHAGPATVARTIDRLHERLRILREREQPCDLIRDALALCEARRVELEADGLQARGAHSPQSPMEH